MSGDTRNAATRIAKRKTPLTDKQQRIALAPWLGWCKHCQSKNLLNNLKNKIRHERIL